MEAFGAGVVEGEHGVTTFAFACLRASAAAVAAAFGTRPGSAADSGESESSPERLSCPPQSTNTAAASGESSGTVMERKSFFGRRKAARFRASSAERVASAGSKRSNRLVFLSESAGGANDPAGSRLTPSTRLALD